MALRVLSSITLLLLGLALATPPARAQGPVKVPLDHWCYGFLERMEALGAVHRLGDGIRPFSRTEIAQALSQVRGQALGEGLLTRIDRERLRQLESEFAAELAQLRGGAPAGEPAAAWPGRLPGRQPLLRYVHDQGEVLADVAFHQQTDRFAGYGRSRAEVVYRTGLGGALRGSLLGGRVGFSSTFLQTSEQGTRTYRLRDDVLEPQVELPQLKGSRADYHQGRADVALSLDWLDVDVGKDQALWGPGPTDNLGLSANAPAFDLVRLQVRLGALKAASIAGGLRPCPDRPDSPVCEDTGDLEATYLVNGQRRTLEREKHLAAHRLEASVTDWLDLGFEEMVIYGDRGPELAYLNPVMFYWAAQSYLGDKDNALMGIDFDLHPGHGLRLYGAYVVDDLRKARIFSNDYANKFSLQAGFRWADPPGLRDTDLWLEYVRLEPWLYTHKFPINHFTHFDAPLGHALGPNSDRWLIRLAHRLHPGLEAAAQLSRTRHGDNLLLPDGGVQNVGGDLHLGWRPGDPNEAKEFLAGRQGRWTRAGLEVSARLPAPLSLLLGYEHEWGKDVPLPPRWEPNVALSSRTGYGDGGQHHLRLDLRYRWP
ncbi:MAG: capsule assembly Wzi family protein [Candidatus Latescibacterota bacterium]